MSGEGKDRCDEDLRARWERHGLLVLQDIYIPRVRATNECPFLNCSSVKSKVEAITEFLILHFCYQNEIPIAPRAGSNFVHSSSPESK